MVSWLLMKNENEDNAIFNVADQSDQNIGAFSLHHIFGALCSMKGANLVPLLPTYVPCEHRRPLAGAPVALLPLSVHLGLGQRARGRLGRGGGGVLLVAAGLLRVAVVVAEAEGERREVI